MEIEIKVFASMLLVRVMVGGSSSFLLLRVIFPSHSLHFASPSPMLGFIVRYFYVLVGSLLQRFLDDPVIYFLCPLPFPAPSTMSGSTPSYVWFSPAFPYDPLSNVEGFPDTGW